ncbi:MAG TPA: hypothetical protein PKW42_01495 [bacterium]|nr:hypothetical protein [bacterium]HPP11382.1 hypothetical protein [bacterium]
MRTDRMQHFKAEESGFTIIEFLIATVVLMIALIATSSFFYANRRDLAYANLERLATWKAIEKIEELKSTNYDSIQPGTNEETVLLSEANAERHTTVEEVQENSVRFKKVTVEVDWDTGKVSLVTYIAQQ